MLEHQLVEVAPAHHEAVVGVHRVLGPLQLHGDAVGQGPQAGVAVVGEQGVVEPHVGELLHGPGGEAVAARLVAGEHRGVSEDDITTGAGGISGRGRAGGSGADDEDVGALRGAGHLDILASGSPGPKSSPLRDAGRGRRGHGAGLVPRGGCRGQAEPQ